MPTAPGCSTTLRSTASSSAVDSTRQALPGYPDSGLSTARRSPLWPTPALQTGGVTGPKRNWFLDDPIHADGVTGVVDANGWIEAFAGKKLPQLCALADGAVSFAVV